MPIFENEHSRQELTEEGHLHSPYEDPRRLLEDVVGEIDDVLENSFASEQLGVDFADLLILSMLFRQNLGMVSPQEVFAKLNLMRKVNIDELREFKLDTKIEAAEEGMVTHGNIPISVAQKIDEDNNHTALIQIVDKMPRK